MKIDIKQFRQGDERQWTIPLLATDLPAGVMPLFVNRDNLLHHVGTAFLISAAGVIATAAHCIMHALWVHGFEAHEFPPGKVYDLLQTRVKLSVLHIQNDGQRAVFSIWSVANAQIAHPTDVAFGCLHDVDAPTARTTPVLTFAVPAPDSWIYAIGYPQNQLPPIDLNMASEGQFDWTAYQPTLLAAIGQVRGLLLQGCEPVAKGPCIVTDCATSAGMSGGPVFSEAGVCGVVTSNVYLPDGREGSALSLFYPTLPISLNLVWNPNPEFQLATSLPLITAAERGLVKSDGTHALHRIVVDGEGFRVDPLIHRDHLAHVFDNRRDFCDGRRSRPQVPPRNLNG
ncbi:MAG TPA: serine protease [Tepidisphaeraceae bacterium]|nr:serine protease [Tepidisphaeraceae bacterium]